MLTDAKHFRSEAPVGRAGEWTIEKITIGGGEVPPESDTRPEPWRHRPGEYTCLSQGGTQFMTDLYDEWWTQRPAMAEAWARGGDVLITGLGLGMIAEAILRAPEHTVRRITIVEKAPEVIQLVGSFLQARHPGKIEIVKGDAFTWEPPAGSHYTVGWHDIWPDPAAPENEAEIARLEAHHGRWCDWQGFWPRTFLAAVAG